MRSARILGMWLARVIFRLFLHFCVEARDSLDKRLISRCGVNVVVEGEGTQVD